MGITQGFAVIQGRRVASSALLWPITAALCLLYRSLLQFALTAALVLVDIDILILALHSLHGTRTNAAAM
jgi:hypothetical protein